MKELKLTTDVILPPSPWKISHQSGIVTVGSCFAEVLGSQLGENKFNVLSNPFGTIFNPVAICKVIDAALEGRNPDPRLYIENQDGVWLHHDFHSSIWARSQTDLETLLLDKLRLLGGALRNADVLVITFGTAYAYRHKASNSVIGNCHKLPSELFIKELLHSDQMNMVLENVIQKMLIANRSIQILLTVSPVRHTRDTLQLNQVSKSTLRLLCHRLSEKYKCVDYFPSYEIMIDELRDYRFYKEDLIHPSELAEDTIFNGFVKTFMTQETAALMEQWAQIRRSISHDPRHGQTKSYFQLLKSVRQKLTEISADLDVSAEMRDVERRIAEFPVA